MCCIACKELFVDPTYEDSEPGRDAPDFTGLSSIGSGGQPVEAISSAREWEDNVNPRPTAGDLVVIRDTVRTRVVCEYAIGEFRTITKDDQNDTPYKVQGVGQRLRE